MDIVDALEAVFNARDEWKAAEYKNYKCNYDPHGSVKQDMIEAKQEYMDKLNLFIRRIKNDSLYNQE